jgi:hypothetical protein
MYPSIQIIISPTAATQGGGASHFVPVTASNVSTLPITLGDDGGSGSSSGGTIIGGTKSGLGLSGALTPTLIGYIPVYTPSSNAQSLAMGDGGSQSPTTSGSGNIGDPKSGLGFNPTN